MNSREILARNLRALMLARKLSTHRVGVSPTGVARMLRGKGGTLKTLDDVSTALGVSAAELISGDLTVTASPRDDRAARLMARLTKRQRSEIYRSMARIAWSNRAVIRENRPSRKAKRK